MEKLITEQFTQSHDRMIRLLAKMQLDVDDYAQRPKANPKAVAIRREIIQNLEMGVLKMDQLFADLAELKAKHEKKSYQLGIDRAKKDMKIERFKGVDLETILNRKGIPYNEQIRAAHLVEAQRAWPELFK